MIRLRRAPAPLVPLLTLLLLSGCDTRGLTVVAEVEESFGFENGLGEWSPLVTTGAGGTASVAVSDERAAAGSRSVRLSVDDPTGTAVALMTRRFDVEPDQPYEVVIVFRLGTLDGVLGGSPWSLRAGATPERPDPGSVPDAGSTSTATDAFVFEDRSVARTATASPDGHLWITLGVAQQGPGVRTYYIDEVEIALTRR